MISVETTRSYDITTQSATSSVYVKLHVTARTSGLIGKLGPERWQTLCVLATFMDADGRCWPTAAQIAGALDLGEDAAQRRLRALCEFRWGDGRAIVTRVREREAGAMHANYRYTILPVAQLSIFDGEIEPVPDEQPDADVGYLPDAEPRNLPDVDVGLTRASNNKIHITRKDMTSQKLVEDYNAKDLIRYFSERYKERYGDEYVVGNYAKVGRQVKLKLLDPHGAIKAANIIDTSFAVYDSLSGINRATYPRVSLNFLTSFGAEKVLPYVRDDSPATPTTDSTAPDIDTALL